MKKTISVLLILSMALFIIPSYAEESEDLFTPGFVEAEISEFTINEDYPEPLMHPIESYDISEDESIALPEKFDARDTGKIYYSGVGQSSDGTCWTFASALVTETALDGTADISEQHIRYACSNEGNNKYGYVRGPADGGNFSMYTAYAAAWRGPVLEEDDPYVYGDEDRDYATVTATKPVAYHLQGTIEVPNPEKYAYNVSASEKAAFLKTVKKYIYKYNCCFSSIYWDSDNYNRTTCAYFNKSVYTSNHAVNLIGWDDNYPKENFVVEPENDGAFIVKNSHGKTGGYFYLSYEDALAGWNCSVVTSVEDKYNYGELYTYDHFEPGAALSAVKLAKTTNVYTSRYDGEYVSAVGVVTKTSDLDYEVYITTSGKGNDKTEANYTLCGTGTLDMPGFHTIKLSTPFNLGEKGTEYCVRVIYTSDGTISVPLEYKVSAIPDTYANPDEGYYATASWSYDAYSDILDGNKNPIKANLYVKAYTDAAYDISFIGCENGKFSINGGEFSSCTDSVAGLNDDITFDFSEYESYYINGTKYSGDEKVTVKLTENIAVTAGTSVEKTVSANEESITVNYVSHQNEDYIVNVSADLKQNHLVFAACYKGNTLIGINTFPASTDNKEISIPVHSEEDADYIKVIICDSSETLSTEFNLLEFVP